MLFTKFRKHLPFSFNTPIELITFCEHKSICKFLQTDSDNFKAMILYLVDLS